MERIDTKPNRRYGTAQRRRNQILIVLVLDCPISDYENEDDDEDERFARPATIWTDTDRLQVRAAWLRNFRAVSIRG